jgi:hypothetical protein
MGAYLFVMKSQEVHFSSKGRLDVDYHQPHLQIMNVHQSQSRHGHRNMYIRPQNQISIFCRFGRGRIEKELIKLISHILFPARKRSFISLKG